LRAIFTYHSIDDSGSPISLAPATFRRHVDWFSSGRVRVVSLDELTEGGDDNRVAITFDDGFRNFATEAAPFLAERGVPVTLFIVSDHVGRTNAWGGRSSPGIPELPLLDWPALGKLADAGVTIGGHTATHPDLTALDPSRVSDELGRSAERTRAELGTRPAWFAYPYGALNDSVAAEAGRRYTGGVTTEYRSLRAREDRLRLPRLDAFYFQRPQALDRWNSGGFRRAIWLRRQARRARALWGRLKAARLPGRLRSSR